MFIDVFMVSSWNSQPFGVLVGQCGQEIDDELASATASARKELTGRRHRGCGRALKLGMEVNQVGDGADQPGGRILVAAAEL